MDGGNCRANFLCQSVRASSQILHRLSLAHNVRVHEGDQFALTHGPGHGGQQEGQLSPDGGGKGTQNLTLSFQAGTRLGMTGGADTPPAFFRVNQQGRAEISCIVGSGSKRGDIESGHGGAGDGGQFDCSHSSHPSTVERKSSNCVSLRRRVARTPSRAGANQLCHDSGLSTITCSGM